MWGSLGRIILLTSHFWHQIPQNASGSWNIVKYNGLVSLKIIYSVQAFWGKDNKRHLVDFHAAWISINPMCHNKGSSLI